LEFCSLSSGSSGNSLYLEGCETSLLVDAGISCKKLCEALAKIGKNPCDIKGILITHEHSDHVKGAALFSRKFNIPIYGTRGTLDAVRAAEKRPFEPGVLHLVAPDSPFVIGNMTICPFRTSHDAADPVCYTFTCSEGKLGMATDLGEFTDYTLKHLAGSNALYVEANHNVDMLMMGPYPYRLKVRIDSPLGHLSNEACGEMVSCLLSNSLQTVMLGHLSQDNNFAELAKETVEGMLREAVGLRASGTDDMCACGAVLPRVIVADRYEPSEIVKI